MIYEWYMIYDILLYYKYIINYINMNQSWCHADVHIAQNFLKSCLIVRWSVIRSLWPFSKAYPESWIQCQLPTAQLKHVWIGEGQSNNDWDSCALQQSNCKTTTVWPVWHPNQNPSDPDLELEKLVWYGIVTIIIIL